MNAWIFRLLSATANEHSRCSVRRMNRFRIETINQRKSVCEMQQPGSLARIWNRRWEPLEPDCFNHRIIHDLRKVWWVQTRSGAMLPGWRMGAIGYELWKFSVLKLNIHVVGCRGTFRFLDSVSGSLWICGSVLLASHTEEIFGSLATCLRVQSTWSGTKWHTAQWFASNAQDPGHTHTETHILTKQDTHAQSYQHFLQHCRDVYWAPCCRCCFCTCNLN